jgi:hypothetical protein
MARRNAFAAVRLDRELRVQAGQPIPDRNLRVVRVARLGMKRGDAAVPVKAPGNFELKRATGDLFDEFARIGKGVIRRLEFRYGLPFQMPPKTGIRWSFILLFGTAQVR